MENVDKLLFLLTTQLHNDQCEIDGLVNDIVQILEDNQLRTTLLPKIRSLIAKELALKTQKRTSKNSKKRESSGSCSSPVQIRNLLFHHRNVPHEYFDCINRYTWSLIKKLHAFDNVEELENVLSYSLGRRLELKTNDKYKIISSYKKQFVNLQENEQERKVIDIARRVFAEASKNDLEALKESK